jgi:hypothetical protein
MTKLLTVTGVRGVAAGVAAADDEASGMPAFVVKGAWRGVPFEYEVAVELEGRDAEWEHRGGADPRDPDDADFDAFLDEEAAIYDAVWASAAMTAARKAYDEAC